MMQSHDSDVFEGDNRAKRTFTASLVDTNGQDHAANSGHSRQSDELHSIKDSADFE